MFKQLRSKLKYPLIMQIQINDTVTIIYNTAEYIHDQGHNIIIIVRITYVCARWGPSSLLRLYGAL